MYKLVVILSTMFLFGCASNEWIGQRNEPLDVQVRFLDSEDWAKMRKERAYQKEYNLSFPTETSDGKCIIYYPAHKGEYRYNGLTQQFQYCS